jgi:mannose-6-phosphate isomerase-like protein (cupin superfamily)
LLRYFFANMEAEFPIRERCHVVELLEDAAVPDISIARCRVEPGVTTELHSLTGIDEVYVVLSGSGIMHDGRRSGQRVGAMDCVRIPAGYPQRVHNDGAEELVFLAICTDRFVPECYIPNEGDGAQAPDYTGASEQLSKG